MNTIDQISPEALVVGLYTSPLKSGLIKPVKLLEIDPRTGSVLHDREFMVADAEGECVTNISGLGRFSVNYSEGGFQLSYTDPESGEEKLSPGFFAEQPDGSRHKVELTVCGERALGVRQGPGVLIFIGEEILSQGQSLPKDSIFVRSHRIGSTVPLLEEHKRREIKAFRNRHPLHVIGQGSIDALNARLTEVGENRLSVTDFRSNVNLVGLEPFLEDRIAEMIIETDEFVVKLVRQQAVMRRRVPFSDSEERGNHRVNPILNALKELGREGHYTDKPDVKGVFIGQGFAVEVLEQKGGSVGPIKITPDLIASASFIEADDDSWQPRNDSNLATV